MNTAATALGPDGPVIGTLAKRRSFSSELADHIDHVGFRVKIGSHTPSAENEANASFGPTFATLERCHGFCLPDGGRDHG